MHIIILTPDPEWWCPCSQNKLFASYFVYLHIRVLKLCMHIYKTHQNAPHVNFCTFVTIGFQHSYYVRTEPKDVARVENKTYVCTTEKSDTVPITAPGVKSTLGNWMDPKEMDHDLDVKFDGCMQGGSFINYGLYHAVIHSYMFVISQSTCILSFLPHSQICA